MCTIENNHETKPLRAWQAKPTGEFRVTETHSRRWQTLTDKRIFKHMKHDDDQIKQIAPKDLKVEDGAKELVDSEAMRPYVRLAHALLEGQLGTTARPSTKAAAKHLKEAEDEIAQLPLEDRYVWRICSALKWGFADFDDVNVRIDLNAFNAEDWQRVGELLKHRPIQFCLFLKALFGAEEMEGMMLQAIDLAKRLP